MGTAVIDQATQELFQATPDLFRESKGKRGEEARNRLIEHYMPLVESTAERVMVGLPLHVELDDLIAAGTFGLMDALAAYDPDLGVRFETFCSKRIQGAIIDELRRVEWVPRNVRAKAQRLEDACWALEEELGRRPRRHEIAAHLEISLEELGLLEREASAASFHSLSEHLGDSLERQDLRWVDIIADQRGLDPVEQSMKKELMEVVGRALSRKERLVLILYYFERLNMREIGLTLDLSESRVCQLHTKIMERLKRALSRVADDLLEQ